MPKIWIDTDIGDDIDDAVCLLCAARHPEFELVGVSTVFGRVELRTWLARQLLDRLGLVNVPVLSGAVARLNGEIPKAPHSYTVLAPELPPASPSDDLERVAVIAKAMREVGPFHFITIGALTNAALLLEHHPDVFDLWSGVTCMAGMLDGEEPDWNIGCDPPAALIILERVRPRLVGMEATSYGFTRQETEALLDPREPASAFLLECYHKYRLLLGHTDPETAPLTLYDPIAMFSIIRPGFFDFRDITVQFEESGRLLRSEEGLKINYALSSDWEKLKPELSKLLARKSCSS